MDRTSFGRIYFWPITIWLRVGFRIVGTCVKPGFQKAGRMRPAVGSKNGGRSPKTNSGFPTTWSEVDSKRPCVRTQITKVLGRIFRPSHPTEPRRRVGVKRRPLTFVNSVYQSIH